MTGIVALIASRINSINFTDPLAIVDLGVASFLVVSFLIYMRRFPVFRVFLGLMFLLFCSLVFFVAGFTLTALTFGITSNLILISLPLIFAPEIRHYLEKLGRFSFLHIPRVTSYQKKISFIKNIIDAVYELAERKIGGTIVITRKTGLGETIETGVLIDAKFSAKLLQSIFFPKNPLHDGAVVVTGERITAAGCLLPISSEVKLSLGTRHRSALAITLDTDAVTLVVSEERGEVSLTENGKLHLNLDRIQLTQLFQKLL